VPSDAVATTEQLETQIPGIDLLPPDRPDNFWDAIVAGKRRRHILGLHLGLIAYREYTRAEIVAKFAPIEKIVPGQDNPPYTYSWLVQIVRAGQPEVNPEWKNL
jgi:hypothetical protein